MPPIVIEKVQCDAHRVLGVTFAGRHLAVFVRLDNTRNAEKLITAREIGHQRTENLSPPREEGLSNDTAHNSSQRGPRAVSRRPVRQWRRAGG